jgi:L,D-peptidoglycan transpeptidase YkuD (ErfK/YbiS/YcfS/YnhG family)
MPLRALLVAAMVGVLGCGRRAVPATGAARDSGSSAVGVPAPSVRIPDSTMQLLVATTASWDATDATLRLWQRASASAPWEPVGDAWPAVVGRTGLAWGRGLHGDGPPSGRPGPLKHEGDGTSPAGIFALGPTYGYAAAPPPGARLPYTTATSTWRCVDDPASTHYTRLLDERTVTIDWTSREDLRRDDDAYRWIIDVRHNPAAVAGGGSCIFLHVWSGPGTSTAGCTAMAEPILTSLLTRLEPAAQPLYVILPAAEYTALAPIWHLPRP